MAGAPMTAVSAATSAHTGLDRVLADVTVEREAQHDTWGIQQLPDGTGPRWATVADDARRECERAAAAGELTWRHVLVEEVAEALAEDDPARLRAELVQVAAVAVQWLQAVDRQAEGTRHGRHH